MNYDKQAALVAQLYKATVGGKVAWENSIRDDTFEASFPRQSVMISRTSPDGGDELYSIVLINKDGVVADEFSNIELRLTGGAPNFSWYVTMKELWQLARRRALGAEDALDDLLGQFDGDDE